MNKRVTVHEVECAQGVQMVQGLHGLKTLFSQHVHPAPALNAYDYNPDPLLNICD